MTKKNQQEVSEIISLKEIRDFVINRLMKNVYLKQENDYEITVVKVPDKFNGFGVILKPKSNLIKETAVIIVLWSDNISDSIIKRPKTINIYGFNEETSLQTAFISIQKSIIEGKISTYLKSSPQIQTVSL